MIPEPIKDWRSASLKADQDRREGDEPRTLCRLPKGRGCNRTTSVPGYFAADRGNTAKARPRQREKFDGHAFKGT
jgi:hypothetical protein